MITVKKVMPIDETFIRDTLNLARRAAGLTQTNPMVGAVIVQNGRDGPLIVGRGYHRGFGLPHAEIEAIADARKNGHHRLSGMTLYVNLEPCCHFGKTPPCTDAIVRERFAKVVCGTKDPFALVAGKGISTLRASGVKVVCGVLESECRMVNRFFFKNVETGLPWVGVKWAQSLDGRTAAPDGRSRWISSRDSRRIVHELRGEYDAVLVGSGTVLADDPQLTVRHIEGRNPWRIILDGPLRIPATARVFRRDGKAVVLTYPSASVKKKRALARRGVTILEMRSGRKDALADGLRRLLAEYRIASVLVEGGSDTVSRLFRHKLIDEVYAFVAPMVLGQGLPAVDATLTPSIRGAVRFEQILWQPVAEDVFFRGVVKR